MESDAAADCAAVETAAAAANVTIVPGETTIDALVQAVESTVSLPSLGSAEDDGKDDDSSSKISRLRVACGDAIAGAVEAGVRASRRKERALDDFYYLLRSRRRDVPITPRSTWREIEAALGSERAWIKCAGRQGHVRREAGRRRGRKVGTRGREGDVPRGRARCVRQVPRETRQEGGQGEGGDGGRRGAR
jgi:hypothetical protein